MSSNGDRDGLALATSFSEYPFCLLQFALESADCGCESLTL